MSQRDGNPFRTVVSLGLGWGVIAGLLVSCGGGGGSAASPPPPATPTTQTVTPSAGANGSISPATPLGVNRGATATFTITASAGYVGNVGGTCGGTLTGTTYTTGAITADCTVIATFSVMDAYYVSLSGSDANSCATAQSRETAKLTIRSGLTCLSPGSTLVIRDGTYGGAANALTNLPNGEAGREITIQAENEGAVVLAAGMEMAHNNTYLVFRGLRFQDTVGRAILGNHLKFFRNEFKGGCNFGNCAATSIGTNDFNDTADILMEDNWFHGAGGRYNLLVYNANRVVVRRGVIRHDGGWTDDKDDPEAGLSFYNSSNCSAQNVLILDNDLTYHSWQGAFYAVYNTASPNASANNSWFGNIAIRSPVGGGFRLDGNGPLTDFTIKDMVMWDTEFAAAFGSGASVITGLTMNRVTAGNTARPPGQTSGFIQFATIYSGAVTNVIIANTTFDELGVTLTNFDSFNNDNIAEGIGRVTYSPFASGLRYLPRIETGSVLKSAGSSGGQIGAQIVSRIGAAGTFYGDAGWDMDTGMSLWPYPNETRIRKEMCVDAGVTRGFCNDSSLTRYIMNYLGNGNPYS